MTLYWFPTNESRERRSVYKSTLTVCRLCFLLPAVPREASKERFERSTSKWKDAGVTGRKPASQEICHPHERLESI